MLKRKLFYALPVAGLLASCASDEPNPVPPNVADEDMTRYVAVSISGDKLTRAASEPTFELGETAENAVKSVWFVFYDADGNLVGTPVEANVTWNSNTTGQNVAKFAQATVGVDVQKGDNLPTQVICYVNPVQPGDLGKPLNEVEIFQREGFSQTEGANTYFAMSNSVYYAKTDDATKPTVAVQIPTYTATEDGKTVTKWALFDTEDAANKALADDASTEDKAKVLNIFVERYASKVKVNLKENFTQADYTGVKGEDNVDIKLTFTAGKWDVNCVEQKSFVVKCFRGQTALGSLTGTNMTYKEVADVLGANNTTNWVWNQGVSATDSEWGHRSFWACSPAYFSTSYPQVLDDYNNAPAGTYPLKYKKYTEVEASGHALTKAGNYGYYFETTLAQIGLNSPNPYAAIPSLIVTGTYRVTVGTTQLPANTDFYHYENGSTKLILFTNQANSTDAYLGENQAAVTGATSLLKYLASKQITIRKQKITETGDDDNKTITYGASEALTQADWAKVFKIMRPCPQTLKEISTTADPIKLASNKVTMQLNCTEDKDHNITALPTLDGYRLVYVAASEEPLTTTNAVKANALLARNLHYASLYKGGRAYFSTPIRHYGWQRTNNGNVVDGNVANPLDFKKVKVGDFGLVRNHVYSLTINSLSGLGVAIGDENNPIIPPEETKKQHIAYKIRMLQWAVVPNQGADF